MEVKSLAQGTPKTAGFQVVLLAGADAAAGVRLKAFDVVTGGEAESAT
jgi:hypothetical protein